MNTPEYLRCPNEGCPGYVQFTRSAYGNVLKDGEHMDESSLGSETRYYCSEDDWQGSLADALATAGVEHCPACGTEDYGTDDRCQCGEPLVDRPATEEA